MEYVTLKVKVDSADAKLNIQSVRKAVTDLQTVSSKPITISVKTSGANASIFRDVDASMGQLDATAVKTGDTFTSLYAKIAKWGIMTSVVYGPIKAFREALTTLKAVDTEMVNVQKVTDYSKEQMEELEENAYALASAYGRTADEITAMYTTFARAGFLGDQLDSMTELGTLLANIGDISQDTASKFLLAVDAAWKLNGSESELMTVMDGLNEITNKNPVDMEALTSGITVAGSVFSEAGESVQTFSSLVGAGVAATQRSGSEISRGLRTIIMNIRQIKGETEDGELVDGESIAKASNALREYAGISTMANGQLRESSAVLSDLAGKWDTLDTVAQSAIAEALAGKRQANILTALMGSWGTVEKMMQDYADGAGSALRENEIYLDSWEAKSKQLTASWTEFVSHLVETDTIKGALDGVIGLVELLDSDTGRFVVTVAALTAGAIALGQATKWLKGTEFIKNGKAIAGILVDAASGAGSFKDVLTLLNPKLLIVAAAAAALYGAYKLISKYVEDANRSLASFDTEIEDANQQLESNKKRIEEINSLPWEQRTSEILEEKKALEEENAELEKQIALLDKQKTERAREIAKESVKTGEMVTVSHKGTTSGSMSTTFEKTVAGAEAYKFLTEQLNEYSAALERNGEIADSVKEQYEKDIAASARMVEALKQMRDAGDDLTEEQKSLITAYDSFVSASDNARNAINNLVSGLIEEARQSGKTEKELYDLVAAQITASNTKLNFSQQIAALRQLAAEAGYAAEAYGNLLNAGRIYQQAMVLVANGKFKTLGEAQAYLTDKAWSSLTSTAPSGGWNSSAGTGAGGSGGGSGSGSDAAERKRAQAEIDALKKARDAEIEPLDDQIDALKKQNEEIERGEKLEELNLDILKKQDALLNARNERTVRMYNAATGQWEWVADAQKVKDAEEALEDAKKDLRDYERQTELDLAIEELEARKEAIKAAYQIKIDAWQNYLDGLSGAVDAEGAYIAQSVQRNKDAAQEIAGAWESTAERIKAAIASMPEGNLDSWKETKAGSIISDVMDDSGRSTGGKPLDVDNRRPTGMASGLLGKTGEGYTIGGISGKRGNTSGGTLGGRNISRAAQYDSGGVLKGLGGIKATADDEMVLPPDITARMLRPSANAAFQARMRELRGLYDPTPAVGRSLAGKTDNRSYTDHSGPEYHYGNITLTQAQAEATTVAQFMRMAHHLQPYKG
nr:MAG TPA: minor tail protein [Caudoviricetes sp.]